MNPTVEAVLRGGLLAAALLLLIFRELGDAQFRRSLGADHARRARNLGFLAASLVVMPIFPLAGGWLRSHPDVAGLLDDYRLAETFMGIDIMVRRPD